MNDHDHVPGDPIEDDTEGHGRWFPGAHEAEEATGDHDVEGHGRTRLTGGADDDTEDNAFRRI